MSRKESILNFLFNFRKAIAIIVVIVLLVSGSVFLFMSRQPIPGTGLPAATVLEIPVAITGARSLVIMEDGTLLELGRDEGHSHLKMMDDVVAVHTQGPFTMIITSDGTLWTQGRELHGMRHWFIQFIWLISSLNAPYNEYPVAIMKNTTTVYMSTGATDTAYVMAITSDGTLWGWGFNGSGQLGIGTTEGSRRRPARVMDDVIAVSAGNHHTMAVTSNGDLWGFGRNHRGELGDGTNINRRRPVKIMENVRSVLARTHHTMAITSDGTLWGWGGNFFGQIGDGTTQNSNSPVQIMTNVAYVTGRTSHTFAITTDGTLWAWGVNDNGILGDGTTEDRLSPVKIMEDVISVSSGDSYAMAITTDGSLWAWGSNGAFFPDGSPLEGLGRLGDGTTEDRHSPVRIMGDVVEVFTERYHTIAVTSDGVLWTWGGNQFGQLGDGTTENRHSPVRIMDGIRLR